MEQKELERRLVQASIHGYDRLDMVPASEMAAVEKFVATVRRGPHSGSVRAIIPMPNAHISRSDVTLRGAVYVTDGSTPAFLLMSTKDLCGAVSLYKISAFTDVRGSGLDEHIKAKLTSIHDASGWCDSSLSLENLQFVGPSMGDLNCSWGVFKSIVNEELEESWHLVVRSYHASSSRSLYNKIHGDQNISIKDVYESKEYVQCMKNAEAARNGVAAIISKHIGAKLDEPLSMGSIGDLKFAVAKPMEVNSYNFIQRISNFKGSQAYAYYNGCYGFSEQKVKMITYGLDRNKGYVVFNYGSKAPQTFGTSDYGYGFPMGSPPENVVDAVSRKMGSLVRWGSAMVYHPKSVMATHMNTFHESLVGRSAFEKMGVTKDMTTLKLVNKSLYISSPDPRSMTVQEIVEWSGADSKMVAIPKEHEFIQSSLVYGYMVLYRKQRSLKLHGDVVVSENEQVFYISVAAIKDIITACKSR